MLMAENFIILNTPKWKLFSGEYCAILLSLNPPFPLYGLSHFCSCKGQNMNIRLCSSCAVLLSLRSLDLAKFCVVDLRSVFRVRIRIGSGFIQAAWFGIRIQEGNMSHKNRKKLRNLKFQYFMFWSAGCSLLSAEGFSCILTSLWRPRDK